MADLTLTQLPLTDSAPSGGCGCGCGCGSAPVAAEATNDSAAVTYPVAGVTCGGCAGRVTAAVEKLPGVTTVNVDLVAGGVSTVTVAGGAAPDAVRRALAEAGYPVTD